VRPPVTVHLARATAGELPAGEAWLTAQEAGVHASLRIPRRAGDWRLGRWVAKAAAASAAGLEDFRPEDIEVLAAPGGAPSVAFLAGSTAPPIAVSLSHSGGVGFAAAAAAPFGLGCDVETLEARSAAFVADYFTEAERLWIEDDRSPVHLRANLLWSAKESVLKALGEGLRMDTRAVEVEAVAAADGDPGQWRALAVTVPGGRTFPAVWRVLDGRVWTVAAEARFLPA
jgi:4'-phosphopantetheinyl transferase